MQPRSTHNENDAKPYGTRSSREIHHSQQQETVLQLSNTNSGSAPPPTGSGFGDAIADAASHESDDIEDDNGDRLINDFMCDIMQENDDGEFNNNNNDDRDELDPDFVPMSAAQIQHNTNPLLLDPAIGD